MCSYKSYGVWSLKELSDILEQNVVGHSDHSISDDLFFATAAVNLGFAHRLVDFSFVQKLVRKSKRPRIYFLQDFIFQNGFKVNYFLENWWKMKPVAKDCSNFFILLFFFSIILEACSHSPRAALSLASLFSSHCIRISSENKDEYRRVTIIITNVMTNWLITNYSFQHENFWESHLLRAGTRPMKMSLISDEAQAALLFETKFWRFRFSRMELTSTSDRSSLWPSADEQERKS